MGAFYASVELLRYPELRGKALMIGGGRNAAPVILAPLTQRTIYTPTSAGNSNSYEVRSDQRFVCH